MFEDSEKVLKKYVNKIVTTCVILSICLSVISIMMIIGGEGMGVALLFFSIIGALCSYVFGALLYTIAELLEQSKLQTQLLKEIYNKLHLNENKE